MYKFFKNSKNCRYEISPSVPPPVSPRKLYGDFEVAAAIASSLAAKQELDTDRISAGVSSTRIQPTLSPTDYLDHPEGLKPFQPPKPSSRLSSSSTPMSAELLLFRRHVAHSQPCPLCDRTLSIYRINILLPCSHIVHPECYEEMTCSSRLCPRCGPSEHPLWDKLLITVCCLSAFR
ncbi:hypothetical protein WR25_24082 [Diploscapter pachys]|uniref:RING-type domain-containing protein n=1 Tax=Diploscapter pachys TaxID=2018661 RepID=A0A2A2K8N6_9BILA|nr:hypothetical protein WR25_24082 [Diploscapter pachys]